MGVKEGEGFVPTKNRLIAMPEWAAPSAFNVRGGSLGAQVGATEIRYIIILNTESAVNEFTGSGKLSWDATANATAGTLSGNERASTSSLEKESMIIYKDTEGVFGGVMLGGTSIEIKDDVNEQASGPCSAQKYL